MIKVESVNVYIRKNMKWMLYQEYRRRKDCNDELTLGKFLQQLILEYLIIRDLIDEHPDVKDRVSHELMKWSVKNEF